MDDQFGFPDCRTSSLKMRFCEIQDSMQKIKICLSGVNMNLAVIEEIGASRLALNNFFSQPCYKNLCLSCQCGSCCLSDYGLFVTPAELIYFSIIGYDLPTPDWDFLLKEELRGKPWCLFMGPNSCLLRENRRLVCLGYYCTKMLAVLKKQNQHQYMLEFDDKLQTSSLALAQEAFEKIGAKLEPHALSLLQYFIKTSKRP